MKISLNGLDLARQAHGDQSVGQVLAELQHEIRAAGHIVTQILLDGRPLPSGWQRRQRLGTPVSALESLDLTVEEPRRLKHQTLEDAGRLAEQLLTRTQPLSRKFRLGEEVTANNDLAAFLEDLKLVLAGLDHTTRDTAVTPLRNRVMESAGQLLPSLDRLCKAQAGGDYVAVADEIEYDLRDQIAAFSTLVREAQGSFSPPPQAQ